MIRTSRVLLAVLTPVALVVGGVAAPTAFAARTATVAGTVVDENDDPLRGIQVWVTENGDDYDYLGATNSAGEYSSPHGMLHEDGSALIVFSDSARHYAGEILEVDSLVAGTNTIQEVDLDPGATVTGTVKAPSGAPLKNVGVLLADNDNLVDPDYAEDTTTADGVYVAKPLGPGDFEVFLSINGYSTSYLPVNTLPGGEIPNQNVANVKAPTTASFTGSSPSKGKATLKVTVSAAYYGLTAIGSGGKFHVYDGSKTVKSYVTVSSTGKATITIGNLKKGSHKFKVKFLGASDTLAKTSSVKSVTVK